MQISGSCVSISLISKMPLGIVVAKFVTQFVAALRNGADPAPFAIADFEDLVDQILRDAVAVAIDDARDIDFPLRAVPASSWRTVISIPSKISIGSKPVMTIGTLKRAAIGSYSR